MGGIGLHNLNTEQGIEYIVLVTVSIRCANESSKSINALLESFIKTSGIIGNPLIQTTPTQYTI
jgi:hypothetical protein